MRRHLLLLLCASLALGGAAGSASAATPVTRGKLVTKTKRVPYSARVTSATPLGVAIVLDQSGSNRHPILGGDQQAKKADVLARAVNDNLELMVMSSLDGQSADTGDVKLKPYFHVLSVGYSTGVRPLIGDKIAMRPISEIAHMGEWLDASGNTARRAEDQVQMRWVKPVHEGFTHMGEGLLEAYNHFEPFVKQNRKAPAPVVMHFSDGDPEGGAMNHMQVAKAIRGLKTDDGHVLLFNVHVGGEGGTTFMFPNERKIEAAIANTKEEKDRVALRRMFDMSSPMPPQMLARARAEFAEYDIPDGARTMVYNANGALVAKLLEMGTVQNMQSRK